MLVDKLTLDSLKYKDLVNDYLHDVYLETVRGAVLVKFAETECIFDAWAQMNMFVTDLSDNGMITDKEYNELLKFVNTAYLEFVDGKFGLNDSVANSIIKENSYRKGVNTNGKGERRRNTNSGRYKA